jgi:L-threonylcarbamoyladenylate synthase
MKDEEADKAGDQILNAKIILYPTDTIWGIGCDATDPGAVEKIYRIKQRSDQKSMLVLMNSFRMLERYLESVPEKAREIIGHASKPTTIVYPGARGLAPNLVAEDGSIGIRIPSDPFCLRLIETAGRPIVSTSANISGQPVPRGFYDIDPEIVLGVDYVVHWRRDDETTAPPSTIIRIEPGGTITVLRP